MWRFKFSGWKNLFINTAGGVAFGIIGATFQNHTVIGIIGGLGTCFILLGWLLYGYTV